MKCRTLTVCSATALTAALLAGNAQAVSITDTPDVSLYLAGSSAAQQIIGTVLGNNATPMLQPGFITFYDAATPGIITAGNDGKNYSAYLGIVVTNPPAAYSTLAGKEVLLIDRAQNGSTEGVIPVAKSIGIANMVISASACTKNTTSTSGTYQYACAVQGDDTSGNSNPLNRIPDFGISDVEPALFEAPYNIDPSGVTSAPLTATQLNSLTIDLTESAIFGVALTNTIPTGTYISSPALGGALVGDISTWNQVNASLSSLPNQGVVVCRRVNGSGTQATFNNWFAHFPCEDQGGQLALGSVKPAVAGDSYSMVLGTASGAGTAANPYVVNAADGYTVVESNSTGNVRSCLQAAQNGGYWPGPNSTNSQQASDGYYYTVNFGTGGYGAIGELSYDNIDKLPPIASSSPGWYFTALDGTAPSQANARILSYPLVSEQTVQYRKTYPAGLALTFIKYYIAEAQQASVLASASDLGVADSILGIPGKGGNSTNSANVMLGTKGGNTCKPWLKEY